MIEVFPVEMEAYDKEIGTDSCVYKLKAFDECCATLTVSALVDPASWPEISESILQSLKIMFPEVKA